MEADPNMGDNLQALLDLAGVHAAMVFDDAGRLLAHRGQAVYDRSLCQQVGLLMAKAVDSLALRQPGWESAAAQYADGCVLLRNLGPVAGGSFVLAVVADGTLNPAFATVALRVASSKARRAIEQGHGLAPSASGSAVLGSSVGAPVPRAAPTPALGSRPVLATSGVSWSQAGASALTGKVPVADAASSAFLARCAKALARSVGPMAKVFVEEAVRRVSAGAPFSMSRARPLAEELAAQVEDAEERATFLKALQATEPGRATPTATLTTFADRSAVLFRPRVLRELILPAYQAFANDRERILLKELLERAGPLAAKARGGLGPNLLIQAELTDALKKLGSEATPLGDLDRLARGPLVTGLIDLLCVPWAGKVVPVQRTWGCPLSEYLEPRSAWIADHLLRGVPAGSELRLPSGAPIRLCDPAEVERLREELALVPRPPGADQTQREYDTLRSLADAVDGEPDLALALWSR